MACFFIARIKIHDRDRYQKYLDGFDRAFEKYDAQVLAVDDCPIVIEGDWPQTRTVIIRFSSLDEAKKWYNSEEYQEILVHRQAASDATVVLIQGKDDS